MSMVEPRKDSGSMLTCRNSALVSGLSPAQKMMFSGVVTIASRLDTPVMLIESAVLPRAICVIRLEIFPPGQAATTIIPSAILGCGFKSIVIAHVTAGSTASCARRPESGATGLRKTSMKSSIRRSSATP